jgi:hypothetical protein
MNNRRRRAVLLSLLLAVGATSASASAATVTVSPLQGTLAAMPKTQISFLGATASALGSISVVGSSSGRHAGRLRSYSSMAGASFIPSKPFTPGEHVTVHAVWRTSRATRVGLSSAFTVARPAVVPFTEFPAAPGKPGDVQSFQTLPELHPPTVTVHQSGPGGAPGYIFSTPFLGPGQFGPMIFDNAGNLVWFHPLPATQDAADLRTQLYQGKNDLTWWQGKTISLGFGLGEDIIANANYRTVATVRAGNGLQADEHEFIVTPHNSAYVLAYSPVQSSLASVGGPAKGIVLDGVIQQIDIRTGLVMWEWHSLEHVPLSDSYSKAPAVLTNAYDYFHINSLTTDSHGNILISARNTWTLYEINPRTGAVTWRLGGKRSSFTLGSGVAFAYQHNAEFQPGGEISLFDDEAGPPVKPPSRGEVIKLDLVAKTATLVEQLVRNPGPLTTFSQGNAQSLPGGGWMVGWGGLPNFTEFNAQGQIIYDAQLPAGFSYRTYREPWAGEPSEPPRILARTVPAPVCPGPVCPAIAFVPMVNVYASWNGSTTVAFWRLYSGSSSAHLKRLSTTARKGFETTITAPAATFFQVRALSAAGKVLTSSKVVRAQAG